jgi:hypothetical protein
MMSDLLLRIVLSVRTCLFQNMVTYLNDLFRMTLVNDHTIVRCLILLHFLIIIIIIIIIIIDISDQIRLLW